MTKRNWRSFELKPIYDENRKSYYKKAYVHIDQDGNYYLESYGTMVFGINNHGEYEKYWDGYSATTMKHIKEFIFQYHINKVPCIVSAWTYADSMNKKRWDKMKVY